MILGRVTGTVVATRKDERLEGFKLLVVQAVEPDGRAKDGYVVAVDTVDAGPGELVLVVSGSSARMVTGCNDRPVDAAIAGVVDEVDLPGGKPAGSETASRAAAKKG
jgi:microcompartment protein CcmK/EutM